MDGIKERTPQEIEVLKQEWASDPCWDIEDTEGFEVHSNDLRNWRMSRHEAWAIKEDIRLTNKAEQLNCSVELVGYIEALERRLARLEAQS